MDRMISVASACVSDKAARTDDYLPDSATEEFLLKINNVLAESAHEPQTPPFPSIFVTGGPRSGTTLLAQALTSYLKCGYVDNLAAKFWKAPATGLRLSRSVFGTRQASQCNSEFGRTGGAEIHGYHYFWLEQLRVQATTDLFLDPHDRGVDAAELTTHIAAMQSVCNEPMVFKGYYPSYYMPWFARYYPDSVFVVIKRSPEEQARSIYQARSAYMRQINDWWSMYPPEFRELLTLPVGEQIAGQVFGLRKMFARLGNDPTVKSISLNFEDFVTKPEESLRLLVTKINKLVDEPVRSTGQLPVIRSSGKTLDPTVESKLATALEKFSAWDTPWTF